MAKKSKAAASAKKVTSKAAPKKAAAKKPVAKKATAKPAAKKAAVKPVAKKPAAKKAATKPAAKKVAAKKAAVAKPAAKKAPAKKAAVAKPAAKKAPAKKAAAKPAAKKAAAKPAAKKTTTRKKAAPKPIVKMNLVAKKSTGKRAELPPMTAVVKKVANPPKAAPKKAAAKVKIEFSMDEFVVYPTHGVGKITGIEDQEISGMSLQVFVIDFAQDKMTLRVPVGKAKTSGMRRLSTVKEMDVALTTLKGRARVKRTMWSRRAQEYEAKINSGDPILIAEVVRDLHRSSNQPDQSYSERQIYEAALGRLARELAAVEKTDEDNATEKLEGVLQAA